LVTSSHIIKNPSGGVIVLDVPQNPTFTTAYTLMSTGTTATNTNYTKTVYYFQDRGNVGAANLGSWEITAMNDGSTNVTMKVVHTRP
jgi:predicted secreted protein